MNPQDPYQPYRPQPTPQTPPQPSQNGQYNVVPPIAASTTTTGHNPYEFIFNADAQKKAPVTGGSLVKRILLVVVGLAILAVLFVVVSSLLSAGSADSKALLKTVAQQQQELIKLGTAGNQYIVEQSVKNTSSTLLFSVSTDQQKLLQYASSHGVAIDPKELNLLQDADTTKLLENAKATSTYDTTWKQTARAQLLNYSANIDKLYNQASNEDLKKLLKTSYSNAQLLSSQLKE